jgi:hypothetical protein
MLKPNEPIYLDNRPQHKKGAQIDSLLDHLILRCPYREFGRSVGYDWDDSIEGVGLRRCDENTIVAHSANRQPRDRQACVTWAGSLKQQGSSRTDSAVYADWGFCRDLPLAVLMRLVWQMLLAHEHIQCRTGRKSSQGHQPSTGD